MINDERTAAMLGHILPRLAGRRALPGAIFRTLLARSALRRQRLRLARLDDHMLRDIGISRVEAEREASRKGWDVPDHWRR